MNEILTQEKSIYLQIAEMIETDILRDILLEEERVPSTNELAKLYAINPATAAKGVNILVDEGILYKKRGIGMFVAEGAKENILNRRRNEFFDHYVKKLLEEAASIEKRSFKKYRFHTGKRKDLWSDRKKRCWKNNIIIDFIRTESGDGGKCDLERRKDMGKQKSIRSYLFLQRTFNQPVWKWCQFIKSKRVFKKCILLLSELGSENGR